MFGPQHGQQPPPLTTEDWKKIEKSMKKPEFLGLLSQYMVEISDPKNKKQYDDYLRQMESEGELPKHMKLVQPKPQFCVKTALVAHSNRSQEMKFFINMCSAPEIQKPSFQAKMLESGEVGQNWRVPHSMGKIRYDQDKNGNICNTVDAVFNPEVFMLSQNKRFEALIINIAIQTAQRQLGQRKQTLSKDYIVLKNLKCKGQAPALLPVRSIEGKLYNKGEGGEIERDRDGQQTKLQKQLNQKKKEYQQSKEKQKQLEHKPQITEQDLSESPTVASQQKGPQRPQFHTIYTYPVEYMDFLQAGVNKSHKIPTALNVEFKIPLVQQFKEIKSLDISENKILLDAGHKYFIDLNFEDLKVKYKLVTAESKAKFDKKKKTLRITIPLDRTSIKEQPQPLPQPLHEAREQQTQAKQADEMGTKTQQIIEENTWQDKDKLLQITEGNVAVEVIKKSQIQEKPQKKFVQEIDEDDVDSHLKTQSPKPLPQPQVAPPSKPLQNIQLPFVLQENPQKWFMIIHLPKYKKQEVEVIHTSDKILLLWNNSGVVKYLKAKMSKQIPEEAVEVVFVVDYVVVYISKNSSTDSVQITPVQETYESFIEEFNKEKEQKKRKQQEQLAQKQKEEEPKKKPSVAQQIKQKEQQAKQKQPLEALNTELNLQKPFQKSTNPQFIHFKIGLVDELD